MARTSSSTIPNLQADPGNTPTTVSTLFLTRILVPDPKLLSKKCSFRRGASARRGGTFTRSEDREIIFRTREKSLFSSSFTRAITPRNRSSAVELLYKVSLPPLEHENPSDKTRLKVGQRPKFCWARLPPQRHNKCDRAPHRCLLQSLRHQLYQWPSSCSCQSCFCRCGHDLQQSTSESAAWQACHCRCVGAGCAWCCLCAPPRSWLSAAPLWLKREQNLR